MSESTKSKSKYTWRRVDHLDVALRIIGSEITATLPSYGLDLAYIPEYEQATDFKCSMYPSGRQLVILGIVELKATRRDESGRACGFEAKSSVRIYVGTPIPVGPEPEPERWGLFDRNGCSFKISKPTGTYTQAIALQFESEKEAKTFVELNGLVNTFTPKKIDKKA